MFGLATLLVLSSSLVFGSPLKTSGCDISSAKLSFPEGQTALVAPTGKPAFISLGVGTQNYTCSDAGIYTSTGAVASLFDISCLYNKPTFDTVADQTMALWESSSNSDVSSIKSLKSIPKCAYLGDHFFVTNPITGTGISPKWNFSPSHHGFVVGAKNASIPAPTGSQDVDWLKLTNVQGDLAKEIYRVDTRSGQPPASCEAGSGGITVKYVAKYWLY